MPWNKYVYSMIKKLIDHKQNLHKLAAAIAWLPPQMGIWRLFTRQIIINRCVFCNISSKSVKFSPKSSGFYFHKGTISRVVNTVKCFLVVNQKKAYQKYPSELWPPLSKLKSKFLLFTVSRETVCLKPDYLGPFRIYLHTFLCIVQGLFPFLLSLVGQGSVGVQSRQEFFILGLSSEVYGHRIASRKQIVASFFHWKYPSSVLPSPCLRL